jgi:hypothetical protein
MIHQNMQPVVLRSLDFILCAIAAKDYAVTIFVIYVATDRYDLVTRAGEKCDVNPAVIVSINQLAWA